MKIRPMFAWYDLWMGAFWDRKSRKLYILPLPCIGVVIEFPERQVAQDIHDAADEIARLRAGSIDIAPRPFSSLPEYGSKGC